MKERGMIFNGEMVCAILDGRKTQTRRIMKVQPEPSKSRPGDFWFSSKKLESMVHVSDLVPGNSPIADCHLFFQEHCCPFGAVGDRIWVRETFTGHYLDDDQIQDIKDGRDKASDLCEYRADYPDGYQAADGWTPSIHMPRWASRILLEITDVRVERLNAISQEDAQAEGMELTGWRPTYSDPDSGGEVCTPYDNFAQLWSSIYGEESWQGNPWVWVIEFKRIEGGEA
ncbi:TPA: hypothetical protein G8N49_003926 [Salmonella enterica]|nr:hypothetical protein [Salmonella enterica subsp. enterica serovar Muenchen]HAF2254998.1 hypothetical protein [Salmonella enterica]HAK5321185.1 hypothetical protein [Salmonella enterica]